MKIALFCANEFAIPLRSDIIYAPLPLFEQLALGVASKGHKVFLYAASNSKLRHKNIKIISGGLVSFDAAGYKKKEGSFHDQEAVALYGQMLMSQMVSDAAKYKFDVIHCYHQPHHFLPFLNLTKTAVVFTLHDPMKDPTNDKKRFIFQSCAWRNKANYISISNNQRLNFPSLNYIKTIYNGIDLSLYKFNPNPDDYFVFLGRVCPEKGTDLAVRAAAKANVKLKIVGPNWGGSYWDKKIKPFWNEKTMENLGVIPRKEVRKILSNAKGLLFTS
ncbi:MAG: glycosyltransferase, partial [bacterium]